MKIKLKLIILKLYQNYIKIIKFYYVYKIITQKKIRIICYFIIFYVIY